MSDLNACSGMRSLGIVGWVRSAIMMAGVVGQWNQGRDEAALGWRRVHAASKENGVYENTS